MANELRFFYNGIKAGKGQLQKCFYSEGALKHSPAGTITIYAREYTPFSPEVRAAFTVQNDTEIQTDYIVTDTIRVEPTHPLYAQVKAAVDANKARNQKRAAKFEAVRAVLVEPDYGGAFDGVTVTSDADGGL